MVFFIVFVTSLCLICGIVGTEQDNNSNGVDINDPSLMGVVIEFTPEGTHEYDNRRPEILETNQWFNYLKKDHLYFECYDYYMSYKRDEKKIPELMFGAKVTTITEGYEIENFAVTSCDTETLPVHVVTGETYTDGYKFVLTFKDNKDTCYNREYVIRTTDWTGSLLRYDAEEVPCTDELNSIASENKEFITDWSDTGTFDRTYSGLDSPHVVERFSLPGECHTATVQCIEHHMLPWDFFNYKLVADIMINNIRLDRVRVTSCTKFSLKVSIKCISHICQGDECTSQLGFMKPDGSCFERSYTTLTTHDEKNIVDYIAVKKGKLEDWACTYDLKTKGYFRMFGRYTKHVLKRS